MTLNLGPSGTACRRWNVGRPWLLSIDLNDIKAIERALETEKEKERLLDVAYWQPFKQELAELRASKRSGNE